MTILKQKHRHIIQVVYMQVTNQPGLTKLTTFDRLKYSHDVLLFISPTRSLVIDSSETPLSTNRDNLGKSTDLTLPVPINQLSNESPMNSNQPASVHAQNESRRSSFNLVSSLQRNPDTKSESSHREPTTSDTDVTSRIPGKSKRSLMVTEEVPRAPSAKHQDRERRQGSVKRNSGKHSKRNSNATTEETILTPIGLDSSKTKQQRSNVIQYFIRL